MCSLSLHLLCFLFLGPSSYQLPLNSVHLGLGRSGSLGHLSKRVQPISVFLEVCTALALGNGNQKTNKAATAWRTISYYHPQRPFPMSTYWLKEAEPPQMHILKPTPILTFP